MPATTDLAQYAPSVAYELGAVFGACKFAADYPKYAEAVLAAISPDHRALADCFAEAAKATGQK